VEASTDYLTGLPNRRQFDLVVNSELARAVRFHTPTALLLLDVDHFKRYNDTNGHDAGDDVLRNVGGFLQGHTRRIDTAARWGGEEFAIVLPNTEVSDAFARGELLRKRFKALFQHRTPALTVSIGVSGVPFSGSTLSELLRSADAALYRAKTTRDRTELGDGSVLVPGTELQQQTLHSPVEGEAL